MKETKISHNKKKGKHYFLFIFSMFFLLLFLSGCFILVDITDSPYGYAGRWQGMPLFESGEDYGEDKPSQIFFVHINQIGEKVFGVLSRVDSYGFSEGPISGEQKDKNITFTARFHSEKLTFEGLWVDDQRAWVGKWSSDLGQKGQVLFEVHKTNTDQSKGFWTMKNHLTMKGGVGKPVIFIHGMNSDGSRWNKLLNELEKRGFYDNHQVWIFQYNWADLIAVNGLDLYKKMNENGIENPIIIAHSMGGLVARSYIAQGGTVDKLITFGTPHQGTPLADLGAKLLGSDNFSTWIQKSLMPGVADMKETSSFINELSSNQNDIENRKKYIVFASVVDSQPIRTTICQNENCQSKVVWKWQRDDYFDNLTLICYKMIPGDNDGYVPKDSALFKGSTVLPKNQYFLNGFLDHSQIVDPEKSTEIVSFLMNLGQ
jgi:pimeloyl-ACP methyl ester carboxylesterase